MDRRSRQPAVVRDREHAPLIAIEGTLQRLCRPGQVVRRFVEKQHGGSAEFEQQDLQPHLLPAAQQLEGLLRDTHQPVAAAITARLLAAAAAVAVAGDEPARL